MGYANQFVRDVIEFLSSQYPDSYQFEVVSTPSLFAEDKFELFMWFKDGYKVVVDANQMRNIFEHYIQMICLPDCERCFEQYVWQKELIDCLEGG